MFPVVALHPKAQQTKRFLKKIYEKHRKQALIVS